MPSLARSCLRVLLLYVVGAVAIGVAVYHRLPELTVAIWSGLIAGFFLWLAIAYLFAIPSSLIDWWRMRPGAKPRDGKRTAVIGTVRQAGASLHAPFSQKACVAYQYKIVSMEGENPSTDYEGFALVPSYIATDDAQVRILAYPELDIPWERLKGSEVKERASAFIESTTFTNTRAKTFKEMMAELRALHADDDGSVRYDNRIEPVTDDLGKCMLEERVLLSGDGVCAIGRYSEEKRALVPDGEGGFTHTLTIRKGTAGSFRRSQIRKAIGSAIGVVFCLAILAFAAGMFLINVPLDASEQKNPDRRFFWEEVKLERLIDQKYRMRSQKPDPIFRGPMYFLDLCNHCATGRLEANDRVVELRHTTCWEDAARRVVHLAAAEGQTDGVTINYGRQDPWPVTVTIILNGKEFVVPKEWLIPSDIQFSLHTNEVLDGRVTVMAPNDAIRLKASFRAPIESR